MNTHTKIPVQLLLSYNRKTVKRAGSAVIIDFSTSCTIPEAIFQMLGLGRGPIHIKDTELEVNNSGACEVTDSNFEQRYILTMIETLSRMREMASEELLEATSSSSSADIIREKRKRLDYCDVIIKKAHRYHLEIVAEFHKVNSRFEKWWESGEVPRVTLVSLNEWCMEKFGISIFDSPSVVDLTAVAEERVGRPPVGTSDTSEIDVNDPDESLQITFAFLVEAYAQRHKSKLLRPDGTVNVSGFSMEMAEIVKEATKNRCPRGQGAESIRKRIDLALKTRDRKLRSR